MISTGKVVQLSFHNLQSCVWRTIFGFSAHGRGRMYSVFHGYEALILIPLLVWLYGRDEYIFDASI